MTPLGETSSSSNHLEKRKGAPCPPPSRRRPRAPFPFALSLPPSPSSSLAPVVVEDRELSCPFASSSSETSYTDPFSSSLELKSATSSTLTMFRSRVALRAFLRGRESSSFATFALVPLRVRPRPDGPFSSSLELKSATSSTLTMFRSRVALRAFLRGRESSSFATFALVPLRVRPRPDGPGSSPLATRFLVISLWLWPERFARQKDALSFSRLSPNRTMRSIWRGRPSSL